MKQYCRYCNNCTPDAYCTEYNRNVNAKMANKCRRFLYSAVDVLMSADKDGGIHRYGPRKQRGPGAGQIEGQLSLSDYL